MIVTILPYHFEGLNKLLSSVEEEKRGNNLTCKVRIGVRFVGFTYMQFCIVHYL